MAARNRPSQGPLPLAPDLVIEIVSLNDRADDLLLKVSHSTSPPEPKPCSSSIPTLGRPTTILSTSSNPKSEAPGSATPLKSPSCCRDSPHHWRRSSETSKRDNQYSRDTHNGCALRSPDRSTHIDPPDYRGDGDNLLVEKAI